MTTQEMYENGLRCKGKGFNCSNCKDKDNCVEYINPRHQEGKQRNKNAKNM